MTTDMKRAKTWSRPVGLAATVLAMTLWGVGCDNVECRDEFDCRDQGSAPQGKLWTCEAQKCVAKDVHGETADAGTDAGTNPVDAGTDAGTDPCANALVDAKLGALQLQTGFTVAESVALPEGVTAVAATPGPTYSLYGLRGFDKNASLYALGTWPTLQLGASGLFNVVSAEDRLASDPVFIGGYVVTDGARVLGGYTKSGKDFPGSVALFDVAHPTDSAYFAAPANYTAAATPDVFLINGGGLAAVSGGLGVYALETSQKPPRAVKVVEFPSAVGGSGFTAVADNGIAMLGFSDKDTYANVAYAVSPTKLAEARTSGKPVTLTAEPKIDVGSDFASAASFGSGVAVLRGGWGAHGYEGTDVSRIPLLPGLTGNAPVSVGARSAVLVFPNQCTSVSLLSSIGSDLLVGLQDKHGSRLVRIHQTAP
ncbi:hypothetical protein DRW03_13730 [Corallococcus sp. H22C18031201]|uniref:hypothetical protein n=1 Tax=Citreicoccus inhibens TaxID=2849499 RepID=UPI000E71513B|nr:hypothetical protein [Citreicoccus inhibens]MBU8895598.1 hypothetical protein [Citreicoccus inhibens]RJS22385.1 hypothetical protein DRW03_13730 [Corallococcus sp. H22C18031201]